MVNDMCQNKLKSIEMKKEKPQIIAKWNYQNQSIQNYRVEQVYYSICVKIDT